MINGLASTATAVSHSAHSIRKCSMPDPGSRYRIVAPSATPARRRRPERDYRQQKFSATPTRSRPSSISGRAGSGQFAGQRQQQLNKVGRPSTKNATRGLTQKASHTLGEMPRKRQPKPHGPHSADTTPSKGTKPILPGGHKPCWSAPEFHKIRE
jgi:hypothetical protein